MIVRKVSVLFLTHAANLQVRLTRFGEKIIPYYSFSLLKFQNCGWLGSRYTPKETMVLQSVIHDVRCLIFGLMMIQCINHANNSIDLYDIIRAKKFLQYNWLPLNKAKSKWKIFYKDITKKQHKHISHCSLKSREVCERRRKKLNIGSESCRF